MFSSFSGSFRLGRRRTLSAVVPLAVGNLFSWGSNLSGRTGLGLTTGDTLTPEQAGELAGWDSVSSTDTACLGIIDGELYGWAGQYGPIFDYVRLTLS